jgi:4-amino-4-deoxy-L-arabinose transferase-like glycosyltransferase
MNTRQTRFIEYGLLALILVLYFVLAYGYATRTPDWQIPDEPAHYNYVRQIVEKGELPVIEKGDWDSAYLDELKGTGFDPAVTAQIDRVQYEDHQPPLYYLLQSIVYRISDGDLATMRLFSAAIGAGVIICAWTIVRQLFPNQAWLGISAAALIAFIPQRLAIMAGVSNDSLSELLAGLVLLGVTLYLTQKPTNLKFPFLIGLLVGLTFLTKTTVYFVAGIAGLAILLRWWQEKWPLKTALSQIIAFAAPALLLGAIWWVHGIQTYGGTDILGLQRHDEVVVGQLRTEDYIEKELGGSQQTYWENLTETTFHSFWGQFGWMALPMPARIYQAILLMLVVVVAGIGLQTWQSRGWKNQRGLLVLFGIGTILVFIQFVIYNRTFVQFQGRYLYPALIPLAMGGALGLHGWAMLGVRLTKIQWLTWLSVVIPLSLSVVAWYALIEIVPLLP